MRKNNCFEILTKILEELSEKEEIGPNLSMETFLRMLKQDRQVAYRKRCKEATGDDNAYAEATEAKKQMKTCIKTWIETEGIYIDYQLEKLNGDAKPLLKK